MKKIFFSTVALAALLGNSFAADYFVDAGTTPTSTIFNTLDDLRLTTSPYTSTKIISFENLGLDAEFNPILTDASLQAPLLTDFPDSSNNTPSAIVLTSNIIKFYEGDSGPYYYLPITISPAAGFEANSSFVKVTTPTTAPRQYPSVYADAGHTFIFTGFTDSVMSWRPGNVDRNYLGAQNQSLGTLRFENNFKTALNSGGGVVQGNGHMEIWNGTYQFVNNSAAWGGAVTSEDYFGIHAGEILFDGNRAVAGNSTDGKAGNGGAVFAAGISIAASRDYGPNVYTDSWHFTNNLASGKGGALFSRDGNIIVTARCAYGVSDRGHLIEFKGNRDNVTFIPDGFGGFDPVPFSGKANALHANSSTGGFLALSAAGGNDSLVFYDPVSMLQTRNSDVDRVFTNINYDPVNPHLIHRGIVTFDGSYWSNEVPSYVVTPADLASNVYGNTVLGDGWMKILNGAVFNVGQATKIVDDVPVFYGGNFRAGGFLNSDAPGQNYIGVGGAVYIGAGSAFNVAGDFTTEALNNQEGGSLWFAVDDNAAGHMTAGSVSFWDDKIYLDLSAVSDGNNSGEWTLFDFGSDLSSDITIRVTFDGVDWVAYTGLNAHWKDFKESMLHLEELANGFIWDGVGAWKCEQLDLDRTWVLTPDGTLSLVPEPTTWALLGLSGLAVVLFRRKKS